MKKILLFISLGLLLAIAQDTTTTDTTATPEATDSSTTTSSTDSTATPTTTDTTSSTDASTTSSSDASTTPANSTSEGTSDSSETAVPVVTACFLNVSDGYYDINSLASESDYGLSVDERLTIYEWNFCKYIEGACGNATLQAVGHFYYGLDFSTVNNAAQWCSIFGTDSDLTPQTIQTVQDNILTGESAGQHLRMTFISSNVCFYENLNGMNSTGQSLTFDVMCNSSVTGVPTVDSMAKNLTDPCHPVFQFQHSSGCALEWSEDVIKAMEAAQNGAPVTSSGSSWLFAIFFIFLILMGPVILFFGKRYFKYLIGLTGLLIGGGIALVFIYSSGELDEGTMGLYFIALMIVAVSGSFLGYVLSEYQFAGLVVACGFAGFVEADLLYQLLFLSFVQSNSFLFVLCVLSAAKSITGAYLRRVWFTIASTSVIGSFFFVRGLAYFIGGYTNELTLWKNMKAGTAEYNGYFLIYLAFIVILGAGGFTYQKLHDTEKAVEEEDGEKKADGFTKV